MQDVREWGGHTEILAMSRLFRWVSLFCCDFFWTHIALFPGFSKYYCMDEVMCLSSVYNYITLHILSSYAMIRFFFSLIFILYLDFWFLLILIYIISVDNSSFSRVDFLIYQEIGRPPVRATENGFSRVVMMSFTHGNHYDIIYKKEAAIIRGFCQCKCCIILYFVQNRF